MRKIILILGATLLLVGLAFYLYFSHSLKWTVKENILPTLINRTKVKWELREIYPDLFNLAVRLKGLSIDNPSGFLDTPQMLFIEKVSINPVLDALFLKQKNELKKIVINNAKINVIRNKDTKYNITPLFSLFGREDPKGVVLSPTTPQKTNRANNPILVKLLKGNLDINYIDYSLSEVPLFINCLVDFQINDLNNSLQMDVLSSSIMANGKISMGQFNTKQSRFEAKGRISSVAFIENMSLELVGSIEEFELAHLAPLPDRIGLNAGKVNGSFSLVALNGKFNSEKSYLRLTFKNLVLNEEKRRQMGNLPLPDSLDVIVPVSGTILNPQIDFVTAFVNAMTSKDTIDAIVNKIIEQKTKIKDGRSIE